MTTNDVSAFFWAAVGAFIVCAVWELSRLGIRRKLARRRARQAIEGVGVLASVLYRNQRRR